MRFTCQIIFASAIVMTIPFRFFVASAWSSAAWGKRRRPVHINWNYCNRYFGAITKLTWFESILNRKESLAVRWASDISNHDLKVEDLHKMSGQQLKMELSFRGLKRKGDRVILISRLAKSTKESEEKRNAKKALKIDPSGDYMLRVCGQVNQDLQGSGLGLALYDQSNAEPVWCGSIFVGGEQSIFEAEYVALIVGVEYVSKNLGVRRVSVQSSCDVLVHQVRGKFKINRQSLKNLLAKEKELEDSLEEFSIEEIRPVENSLCKELAQEALSKQKSSVPLKGLAMLNLKDPIKRLQEVDSEEVGDDLLVGEAVASPAIDPSQIYLLRFDGGSRGNPGKAGAGAVLYDSNGDEIWFGWKFCDKSATNNYAEYMGLLVGIQRARSFGIQQLIVEGDSQLVVRQISGEYKCRELSLKKMLDAVLNEAKGFEYFEARHIPRAENARADWLANQAMDLEESAGFEEIENGDSWIN